MTPTLEDVRAAMKRTGIIPRQGCYCTTDDQWRRCGCVVTILAIDAGVEFNASRIWVWAGQNLDKQFVSDLMWGFDSPPNAPEPSVASAGYTLGRQCQALLTEVV